MIIKINNGSPLHCVEGSLLTRNYNETLDSANVRIVHQNELLDIEPYDDVQIYFGDDEENFVANLYMLVDSFECIEEGLDPIHYTYEISLFSVTKQLENIILPNIAITPNSENRTILYYLQQYLTEYGKSAWQLSQDPKMAKFNVPCPEMQWNTPTLREVFDDLMMVVDCICVFEGTSVISFLDLTERGLSITDYNYIRRSRSSQDYVSEIRMELQNAMEDGANVVTEVLPFNVTGELGIILTDENFVIKTQYPIRKVNHLWLHMYVEQPTVKDVRFDLVNFFDETLVREYQEYITMPIYFKPQLAALNVDENNIYKYRNFCLYFQRYSKTIEGLNEKMVVGSIGGTWNLLYIIFDLVFQKVFNTVQVTGFSDYTLTNVEIEYETTQSMTFSASRIHPVRNKRVIMDNQANSFVNVRVQAGLEYQKINRLGNEQLMINQRTNSIVNAIKLAQVHNDSVVYQVQYQIYSDHVEVNALATKDYILRNYFTGIKSHIRTWVNAKDEAITRHELIKDTYRLSYTQTDFTNNNWFYLQPLLNDYDIEDRVTYERVSLTPTHWCGIQPLDENGDSLIGNDAYIVDLIVRKLNNSIVFTFGCETNSYVYKYIDVGPYQGGGTLDAANDVDIPYHIKNSFKNNYGGVPYNFKTYVDGLYENYGIKFVFIYNNDNFYYDTSTAVSGNAYDIYKIKDDHEEDYFNSTLRSPVKSSNLLRYVFEKEVHFHKDNKEISQYSYQLEFICDDDMFIGEKFIEYQQLVREGSFSLQYYKANTLLSAYDSNKMSLVTDMVAVFYDEMVAVRYTTAQVTSDQYLYVCDGSNNIIIAFKYKQNTIYLNKE